ncbi:alkylation response protein AidB-like acyl-CoA dehydrogenase [Polymorphobacter multimanifer]|uniref:Alkylation response protein AidB-like acyl-CoA dehydrogenase n=1 Tax=Polymorphobacter multimanifer TaxID=1070431 RepID=A0A841LCU2_9SPHN|nr:acyl-CoA dehydrogenase family protein [Polymorphobacter multimanifer]MBB6226798.1 alkylation response protein AidB-like acyl-CoA dehydrogenase [Polymorphobacter multimanifer]
MNFDFSDDAKALGEQAQKLLAERGGPAKARLAMGQNEEGGAPDFDAGLWAEVAGLGWTAARVPEAHGGLGMSAEESAMLAEAAGEHLACVPLVSTLLATEALLLAGTAEQQARWFPGIASGEVIAVPAWNEPGIASPLGVAVRVEGGRISGVKAPVADLAGAQLAIVAAAGADGPSLWIVEVSNARVEAVETLDLVRRHGRLVMDGTPAEPLGTAADYLAWLDRAAVILAFEAMGTARAAMTMTVEYAKTRVAFGQTIGRYQGVKHKCADMYIKLELARAHALHGLALLEAGGAELTQAASAARVASLEALTFTVEETVQLHGGIGFTWESDCQFYYRRGRTLTAALGARGFWADRLVRALELRNRAAA